MNDLRLVCSEFELRLLLELFDELRDGRAHTPLDVRDFGLGALADRWAHLLQFVTRCWNCGQTAEQHPDGKLCEHPKTFRPARCVICQQIVPGGLLGGSQCRDHDTPRAPYDSQWREDHVHCTLAPACTEHRLLSWAEAQQQTPPPEFPTGEEYEESWGMLSPDEQAEIGGH